MILSASRSAFWPPISFRFWINRLINIHQWLEITEQLCCFTAFHTKCYESATRKLWISIPSSCFYSWDHVTQRANRTDHMPAYSSSRPTASASSRRHRLRNWLWDNFWEQRREQIWHSLIRHHKRYKRWLAQNDSLQSSAECHSTCVYKWRQPFPSQWTNNNLL